MKKSKMLMIACAFILMMTACGNSGVLSSKRDFTKTTVSIGKNQDITEYIVEKLDKDYYDADELRQEMEEAVSAYNEKHASGEDVVSLKSFDYDTDTQTLKARMVYRTYRDYASIHNCDFFVGTISEAGQNGYEWSDLKEAGTQSADETGSDEDKSEQMVVICSEAVDVEVPGDVWYLSDGASVDASGLVTVGQSDGYSVIIYK